MGNTRNGRHARDTRRNDAAIRQAERDGITDEQQLSRLIHRGHGHCIEAQRLFIIRRDAIGDKNETPD